MENNNNSEPWMDTFIGLFNDMQTVAHSLAVQKGWWDSSEWNEAEKVALMHSELSECLEALRHGNPPDDKIPEFSGAEAELADTVIRIMDFAAKKKLRLAEAIVAKHRFNATRPHKHGGKKF